MRAVLALGLCGCSSIFGLKAPQLSADAGGGDADAAADGSSDGTPVDAQQCFGSGEYAVCFDALPTMTKNLTGNINTAPLGGCATGVHWVSANQPAACFITGTTVTVGPLVATGALPLVIVATDSVTFTGLVDLSTHRGAASGAGAGTGVCGTPGAAEVNNNGGGGGAGGTFGTVGGKGGNGSSAALGGTPALAATIDVLGGGCSGEAGARGGGGQAGAPGGGGGALYVVAGNSIVLGTSTLAANGAGGEHAQNRWGGSGGGAGGMIVLYAPSITASSAILVANGGGGASGTDSGGGTAGDDPSPMMPSSAAAGGTGVAGNPSGGAGYAAGTSAGDGGASPGGITSGAGGGGGAGYIRTNVAITGVTASPAIVVMP